MNRDSGAATAVRPPAAHPTRAELQNGLVVIFHENHANPTVAIHGLVKAGAIFDPPRLAGLSSFVASMLDRGTRRRTAFQQAEALESLGASLHFDSGPEAATFSGNALSEDLASVLDVLADALRNAAFTDDQIGKARDELLVRVKISNENTAYVASRVANEILYPPGHPYHRPWIGTEAAIAAVTREDLAAFHTAHYGPNTTILALAGDVDPVSTLELVRRSFHEWSRLPRPQPFAVPAAPKPARPERRIVPMKGKSQVDVVCALPGISRTEPDFYAAMIANFVLGGGSLSSRLMDNLRDKHGLVYGVYSNMNAGVGAGPIQIRAGANPANADRTAEEILSQVSLIHAEGPTEAELEEAVSYLTGVFPVRLETNAGVASQILGAELYGLGLDYIARYPAIIRGVSLEDARAAARKYLDPSPHALAIAGSYPEEKPPGGD
jgi:zinc protease